MNRLAETNVWPNDNGRSRSAALRAEPVALSQAKPADAIASMFAEQHQIDPDEAYRYAVYAEIKDGLIWLGWGALAAMLLVVGVLYFGAVS